MAANMRRTGRLGQRDRAREVQIPRLAALARDDRGELRSLGMAEGAALARE
jgi:hypothetical protein